MVNLLRSIVAVMRSTQAKDWRDSVPHWFRSALAGAGSGMTTKTCVAPLERVKILLQIQAMKGYAGATAKYRGVLGTVRRRCALRGRVVVCVRVCMWGGRWMNCAIIQSRLLTQALLC